MVRIAIPDDAPSVISGTRAHHRLAEIGDVTVHTTLPGSRDELLARIDGAHSVLTIRASSKFRTDVLEACKEHLRHVAIWGTGTDAVDLDAARRLGITVSNTPNTATESLAEHCLALLLAVGRRMPELDTAVRRGEWPRGMLFQAAGKTLGIIGTGAIGTRFAALAVGIGMKVIAWTYHPDHEKARRTGFTYVATMDDLLERSDVVSVHLRSTPETHGMLGAAQFARMKQGALFINTARGDIVDEDALLAALRSGQLRGGGFDVFVREPLPRDSPFFGLSNTVLTPHNAGATPEALQRGLDLAADNVIAFAESGQPLHRVV